VGFPAEFWIESHLKVSGCGCGGHSVRRPVGHREGELLIPLLDVPFVAFVNKV
jgi:hypothetical protein